MEELASFRERRHARRAIYCSRCDAAAAVAAPYIMQQKEQLSRGIFKECCFCLFLIIMGFFQSSSS